MRKALLQALIAVVMVAGISEAARVTKAYTFSSGQTIRSADVNKNFDDIYNEFNGSIEGGASGNIAADSLTETEMADDINPRVRWDEGFQDWVYTGLLPADSANLTSDISAGSGYVQGYRVSKASATSKTYTATKDTYVDIDYNATFHYTEVARLAAAPAVYTDSMRLAAVATDGVEILQVTDLRVLTPYSTGSSKDMITRGFELVWASTTTVTVNPGTLYVNVTQVDKTATETLDITAAGDAIDGVAVQAVSTWVYVYVDNAGNCKLYATAPTYADTNNNTDGTKLYYKYGSTFYRCIGAIRLNAVGAGEVVVFYQTGNFIRYDVPNLLTNVLSAGAWSGAISCGAYIPPISICGIFGVKATAPAGNNAQIALRPNGSTWDISFANGVATNNGNVIGGMLISMTDSSQQINYYNAAATSATEIYMTGYYSYIR